MCYFITDTVLCPTLDDPGNGSVSVYSNFVGDSAYYRCNYGYRRSGSSYRTCLLSGEWSGTQPTCISKYPLSLCTLSPICIFYYVGRCSYLSPPENGGVSMTTSDVGGTATYTCNSGFRLIGSSNRTCLSNGIWSGSQPICNSKF